MDQNQSVGKRKLAPSWGSEGREEINVTDVKADTISWCTLLLSHHLQPQKMSKWRILGKLRYSCNWAMG